MPIPKPRISGPGVVAALGAGLASALLSMLVTQKTSLALAMGFLSPLPIMIAALGFGSFAGLLAVVVGTVAVGLFDMRPEGLAFVLPSRLSSSGLDVLVFAVSLGLPAWLLSRLALAPTGPRPADALGGTNTLTATVGAARSSEPVRSDELLLGRLVAVAVGFAAAGVALDFAIAITRLGGFDAFMAATISKAEPLVQSLLVANRSLPKGLSAHDIARAVTWGQTPLMAGAQVILLVFNVWLAARIAQRSGLLSAPWPDIPRHLRVPRPLAIVLAVSLGLAFAGGLVGMMSLLVSGAVLMGFSLQGLAVIHAVSRGKSFRLPLLIIVYLSMAMPPFTPWLIVFYGLVGLVDTAFAFRDRPKPTGDRGPWQSPKDVRKSKEKD